MPTKLSFEKLSQIISEATNLPIANFKEENTISDFFNSVDIEGFMEEELLYFNIRERVENEYGVRIRYPHIWYVMSASKWISHVNRMVRENGVVATAKIGWVSVQEFHKQRNDRHIPEQALTGSVSDFLHYFRENDLIWGELNLYTALADLIDYFYLDFSDIDLEFFNKKRKMSKVYDTLNEKLRQRKPNDCRVYYGKSYSLKSRNDTMEHLQDFPGYPIGIPIKHISGKSGVIATEGITGVDGKDVIPSGGMICVKDREENVLYEYCSKVEMIDDGWVID